jgi:hypothetical protein
MGALGGLLPSILLSATPNAPTQQDAKPVVVLQRQLNQYPRVRPELAQRLVMVESRGQLEIPDGARGEIGAMQMLPQTFQYVSRNILHKRDGEMNPRRPQDNITVGMALLNWLLERYANDETLALIGYKAGLGAADSAARTIASGKPVHLPRATRAYVTKILGPSERPVLRYAVVDKALLPPPVRVSASTPLRVHDSTPIFMIHGPSHGTGFGVQSCSASSATECR